MPGILDKLNVLVKANLNQWRRREAAPTGAPVKADVAAMRQQIERALAEDDRFVQALAEVQQAIDHWDRRADEALTRGDEATARHAIRQVQLKQQALTLLEADRTRHRMATLELIHQVNALEVLLAEAQRQQPPEAPPDTGLAAHLDQARDALARLSHPPDEAEPSAVDEQAVEDDLARRRARLSL